MNTLYPSTDMCSFIFSKIEKKICFWYIEMQLILVSGFFNLAYCLLLNYE